MILSSTKKLMQYIADKENKTPLYSFLANKFLNNDQVEKSREICIAGEKEFPQDAYGKYIRAKIENQRGNHDLYLEKLEECIKLDSGFLAAYYHLIACIENIYLRLIITLLPDTYLPQEFLVLISFFFS